MSFHRRLGAGTGPLGGSGLVAQWGGSSLIQSLQTGQLDMNGVTTKTATITAVDTSRSICVFNGSKNTSGEGTANDDSGFAFRVALTNSTTVTADIVLNVSAAGRLVNFTVVEFLPGVLRSVQRGSITMTGVLTNTATITGVNPAKSLVTYNGYTHTYTSDPPMYLNRVGVILTLTNATTVTTDHGATNGTKITNFEVVEFF